MLRLVPPGSQMHENGPKSPARLLAPLALVAVTIAVVLVVLVSAGGDGDSDGDASAKRSGTSATSASTTTTPGMRRRTYTVKTGDTLGLIAEKTGVSVERLQELNPELDPQALLSGQKINLRE
jgi:LysM repeat protein